MSTLTRGAVAALLPLVVGCASTPAPAPTPAPAQTAAAAGTAAAGTTTAGHDMAGMSHAGHDMSSTAGSAGATAAAPAHDMASHGMGPVTIPPGARYVEADVRFMQGMIAHHAQAIHMSRLATTRGASDRVQRFAHKIDQGQASEIRLMQEWLRAHGQTAPDTNSWHGMTMAGMLTPAQLATLEAARGREFDEHFLKMMIQHHEGALKMVADLLATPMAAQDVDVDVFANDVETTQTAEIALMHQMLATLRDPSTGAR